MTQAMTRYRRKSGEPESASMIPPQDAGQYLDLEQMTVNDIMAPRNEIYGIDIEALDEAIMRQLKNSAHTRLPIYRDDINQTEGVHMRDLSRVLDKGRLSGRRCRKNPKRPISSRKTHR